jgi:hypothetical protein
MRSQWCANRTCKAKCNLADLCTVHRGDSCEDYPGRWILYHGGAEVYASKDFANTWVKLGARDGECEGDSICWCATDGDPRVGQVWFTGFYRHGTWDSLGTYRS